MPQNSPRRFRKDDKTFTAVRFFGGNIPEIADFMGLEWKDVNVKPGCWVVRSAEGDFQDVPHEAFVSGYEAID